MRAIRLMLRRCRYLVPIFAAPWLFTAALATPYTPKAADEVVAVLPSAINPAAHRSQILHKLLKRAPTQVDLATQTAAADIAAGRAEADPRFYGHAEAALAPWWQSDDPPNAVLLLRATVKQNRHEFPAALTDLDTLLERAPGDLQGLLTRAVVYEVRGEFEPAARDCDELTRRAPGLAARTCVDVMRSLTGHAPEAFADLMSAAQDDDVGRQVQVWTFTTLGEMAQRLGDDRANSFFRRALQLDTKDSYLLAAYADYLIDQNRAAEVIPLLEDSVRIDPLLLRLAIAEKAMAGPNLNTHVADLKERFRIASARGDRVHLREQSMFALAFESRDMALALARANWEVQREPADVLVFLRAADAAAAQPVLRWVKTTGLEDVRLAPMLRRLGAVQ